MESFDKLTLFLQDFGEFKVYYGLFFAVLASYSAYFLAAKCLSPKPKSPPSPPRLPIIGNLHQLGHLPHRFLRSMARKYGPLMLLHLGSKPMLVVSSSEVAREVFKSHDIAFASKPVMSVPKKIFCDMKDVVFLPYGDQWRKLRSIVVNRLLNSNRVKSFSKIRDEETHLVMEQIGQLSAAGAPVNLTKMFSSLTNDMICRAAFGKKHSETEHGKRFLEKLDESVELMYTFTLGEFVPWLKWINWVNGFDARVDNIVRERDEIMDAVFRQHMEMRRKEAADGNNGSGSGESFMDILMDIHEGDTAGVAIDEESVKAVILDVFGAGTETSSTALGWAMSELIRHPQIMKKLQTEIRQVMKGKTTIDDSDLANMPYLKAVIKENFRLHPPIAIYPHESREDVDLMGYHIPSGTMILFNAWAIGREPESWDDPERFYPDRFLNSPVDYKGFDFQLLPFGAGRRICPGISFATMSIEHILANLVHKFDWGLPDGRRGEELDDMEHHGLSVARKNALVLTATKFRDL